jgi:hypothetical protein
VASCRIATSVDVDAGELSGGRKGLPDYRQQSNFPNPWPGGHVVAAQHRRLRADRRRRAARNLLAVSREILKSFYQTGWQALEAGRKEAPFAYVVPATQRDPLRGAPDDRRSP